MSYKKNTNLSTGSPGILLYEYFNTKYKTVAYDEYKPDIKIKKFEKNINAFAKQSDVIFVCYPIIFLKNLKI